ncbi:MAG TPA: nitroreductase [Steroidobacteraceae bacterium]|nr:nitroreductase [Steroidobacteraceae bacterium]
MELLQAIEQRRAVREYTGEPVDPALLERLVRTATLAPSAMNQQPWSFAVITGARRIEACARRAREYALSEAGVANGRLRQLLADPATSIFHHAPALVLVLAQEDDSQAREDCCLAAQTFMLAARDAGLGTCWIGLGRPWLNLPEVKAELGLPLRRHVVAPIIVGHPGAWPPAHERRAAEIHWIR